MISILVLIILNSKAMHSAYIYEDDDITNKNSRSISLDDGDFEPVTVVNKGEKIVEQAKNMNCDHFSKYAVNCTIQAAMIYNSSKKSPPMPGKIFDWCRAIRHLTNCAIDWNSECTEFTEKRFNEESIKGHMHVVNNVCDDDFFLTLSQVQHKGDDYLSIVRSVDSCVRVTRGLCCVMNCASEIAAIAQQGRAVRRGLNLDSSWGTVGYDDVPACIETSGEGWEACYNTFKQQVNYLKNGTQHWTHYDTHFKLCCVRTRFRRCTLDVLFDDPIYKCHRDQAITLQKFSVIVSEGDVYQDCEHNMMYSNCPGGDPRPSGQILAKLMNDDFRSDTTTLHGVNTASTVFFKKSVLFLLLLIYFCII